APERNPGRSKGVRASLSIRWMPAPVRKAPAGGPNTAKMKKAATTSRHSPASRPGATRPAGAVTSRSTLVHPVELALHGGDLFLQVLQVVASFRRGLRIPGAGRLIGRGRRERGEHAHGVLEHLDVAAR